MPENTSDIDQHIERYRRLLERDPNSRVFAPLAEACRKANRLEEALEIARTGVAIHPAYASGRVALARAQLALDRHDEAAGELVQAISHAPENALAHRLLGEARVQLGDRDGAFEAFARALALNPDDEEARQALVGIEPAPAPVVVETPAAPAAPQQAAEDPGTFAEAEAADETPEPTLETDALPAPWWEDGGIQAASDGAEAFEHIGTPDPAPAFADPEATDPEATDPEAAEPESPDPIVLQEVLPDPIPLLDPPSDSDLPGDELALDLELVGQARSAPENTFAEALVETAPDLADADSIWEEQSGPELAAGPPDFGPAGDMLEDMLEDSEEDPSGVVLLEDELPEIEADIEVTETGLADAALGPLSRRLDELDISTSSLAPEARQAVPRELPEETVPLDGRVEELADQYLRLGYPDRARALLRSLLEGNPMNLSAKRKMREMGSAGQDVARAPAAGDQSVRRKVEENVDVLNRWLANIRKGAAR